MVRTESPKNDAMKRKERVLLATRSGASWTPASMISSASALCELTRNNPNAAVAEPLMMSACTRITAPISASHSTVLQISFQGWGWFDSRSPICGINIHTCAEAILLSLELKAMAEEITFKQCPDKSIDLLLFLGLIDSITNTIFCRDRWHQQRGLNTVCFLKQDGIDEHPNKKDVKIQFPWKEGAQSMAESGCWLSRNYFQEKEKTRNISLLNKVQSSDRGVQEQKGEIFHCYLCKESLARLTPDGKEIIISLLTTVVACIVTCIHSLLCRINANNLELCIFHRMALHNITNLF